MKKTVASVALVFCAALLGCGSDLCGRSQSSCKGVQNKVANCPTLANIITCQSYSSTQVQNCENNLKNCTVNDTNALNSYLNCIDGLPNCVAGQEAAFSQAYSVCSFPVGITPTCASFN